MVKKKKSVHAMQEFKESCQVAFKQYESYMSAKNTSGGGGGQSSSNQDDLED